MELFSDLMSISPSSWVAPTACLVGNVSLLDNASVWFGSVLRADNESITVGDSSNVQDGCIIHNDVGYQVSIGAMVTVGHGSILHGCIIDDTSLIGMGCVLLNGCRVSSFCIIGAGTLLVENIVIPEGSLVVGRPGKVVRQTSVQEIEQIRESAVQYSKKKEFYRNSILNNA